MPRSDSLSAGRPSPYSLAEEGLSSSLDGLCLHSTSLTPEGSSRLRFPGLHRFLWPSPTSAGLGSLLSRSRGGHNGAADFA